MSREYWMIKKLTTKGLPLLLILLLACVSVTAASANTFESNLSRNLNEVTDWQIQLPKALEAHEGGAVFVDIRSLASYEQSHVSGAIHLPLTDLSQTLLERSGVLPKDQPIYVICCAKDCNAMLAVLPLRMAGYEAYGVMGGGVPTWEAAGYPIETGTAKPLESKWKTKLKPEEIEALSAINPTLHMMKVGRSYTIARKGLEEVLASGETLTVIEIIPSRSSKNSIIKKSGDVAISVTLSDLPKAEWLKGISKNEKIYLIGEDDKELAIGLMSLRMMGYDAVMAVWE